MIRGILVVVSGFSGGRKGTLMRALLEKYHNYALSVSSDYQTAQRREKQTERTISLSARRNLSR